MHIITKEICVEFLLQAALLSVLKWLLIKSFMIVQIVRDSWNYEKNWLILNEEQLEFLSASKSFKIIFGLYLKIDWLS